MNKYTLTAATAALISAGVVNAQISPADSVQQNSTSTTIENTQKDLNKTIKYSLRASVFSKYDLFGDAKVTLLESNHYAAIEQQNGGYMIYMGTMGGEELLNHKATMFIHTGENPYYSIVEGEIPATLGSIDVGDNNYEFMNTDTLFTRVVVTDGEVTFVPSHDTILVNNTTGEMLRKGKTNEPYKLNPQTGEGEIVPAESFEK